MGLCQRILELTRPAVQAGFELGSDHALSDPLNACVFSDCRKYRYALDHDEGDLFSSSKGYAAWIGLNPSIADEGQLDPTLRRILGFTKQLGLQRFVMLNLFALVSTDPQVMLKHADPVGPMNDHHIVKACEGAAAIVCCWGGHGMHLGRADSIFNLLAPFKLNCLGVTSDGQPRHPLYLPGNTCLQPYSRV
jgi:hypothetical protein